MSAAEENPLLDEFTRKEYEFGFTTDIDADKLPPGLNEARRPPHQFNKKERAPVDAALAPRRLSRLANHGGARLGPRRITTKPDYQAISYYSAPKSKAPLGSLDEVDPELRATMDKLGISMEEQKRLSGVAVDFVMDSVSVATSFKDKLAELGIIFCSMSEAIQEHP